MVTILQAICSADGSHNSFNKFVLVVFVDLEIGRD